MSNIVFQVLNHPDHLDAWMRFGVVDREGGHVTKVGIVSWVDQDPYGRVPAECGFSVAHEDLQSLADALWDHGVRPSKMVGGVNADLHAAVKEHLSDLRGIINKKG